jgi:hypothetical protein
MKKTPPVLLIIFLSVIPVCNKGDSDNACESFSYDESASISYTHGVGVTLPSAGEYYHGVYPGGTTGEEDDITSAGVDEYELAVDKQAAWIYFSNNWFRDRTFPLVTATWIRDRGSIPFIRLMLRSDTEENREEPAFTLKRIIQGNFDDDLTAWGDAAKTFGTPLLVEWGTEMNGYWFSWNGTWNCGEDEGPKRFRSAFRHIVRTISSRGADNITWVFHINSMDDPDETWNRFENYYPGDDAVDWVGISSYGALTPLDEEWPIFEDGVDASYQRLAALTPGKPMFILEFGVTMNNTLGDPVAWADTALAQIISGRWPLVRGFSWWNETWQNDDNPAHDTDMRVQYIPGMAPAFKSRLSDTHVLGRPL